MAKQKSGGKSSSAPKSVGGASSKAGGRGAPNPGNTRSYGPKTNSTSKVKTISNPGGRGNPLTAANKGKTRSPIGPGSGYLGYVQPKKNKGKGKGGVKSNTTKLPLETQEIEDPIVTVSDAGGDYQGYSPTTTSVKIPDRDAIIALQRDGADQALITAVLFEQIGATELVKFTRNDTIDGLNGVYDVISNISELKTKLDPSYLISKQRPDVTIDNGFSIRLQDKLPSIDYLFENEIPNYVHFDSTIGDGGSLVIELDNMDTDEIIEVEIDTSGTIEEVR